MDAQRPQNAGAISPPTRKDYQNRKETEKPVPKPMTPREKVDAITPASDGKINSGPSKTSIRTSGLGYLHAGSALVNTYQASRAPAKQALELRHGE